MEIKKDMLNTPTLLKLTIGLMAFVLIQNIFFYQKISDLEYTLNQTKKIAENAESAARDAESAAEDAESAASDAASNAFGNVCGYCPD